ARSRRRDADCGHSDDRCRHGRGPPAGRRRQRRGNGAHEAAVHPRRLEDHRAPREGSDRPDRREYPDPTLRALRAWPVGARRMADLRYRRVLLKISGEALMGDEAYGIDPDTVSRIAAQIKDSSDLGTQVAVVVGGGNIWRGAAASVSGMDRATADYAGMLATMINALALQDAIEQAGGDGRTQTANPVQPVREPYIPPRAHP